MATAPISRSAGILLHITSLPSPFGIGDLGPTAYRFTDLLKQADATWWQILPLTPPAGGESPYCSISTFAGNPLLISPELLRRDGLLTRQDLCLAGASPSVPSPLGKAQGMGSAATRNTDRVNYPAARAIKTRLLMQAHERFRSGTGRVKQLRDEFVVFCRQQAWWLDDFALYAALRETRGHDPWPRWERSLARRQSRAISEARAPLSQTLDRIRFEQFIFTRQLVALRQHAHSRGIRLMGDVPIYMDLDSADVWSHPQWFRLRPDGLPSVVAGVPPDYFSKDGQLWGNPLYNWNAMRKDGFDWWIRRIRHLLQYVDEVRVDHFRGLQACWEVPAGAKTAKKGRWVISPGAEILTRLRDELGGRPPLVAEDLGTITPEVEQLRDDFTLPGMRVLQFGFGDNPSSTMLPHHYPRNVIVYTGTHDNDTTLSWYRHLPARTRAYLHRYAPGAAADPVAAMIRLAMSSVASLAIIPLQDLLRLGREARMNTPGTMTGNWSWRMHPAQLHPSTFTEFRRLARTFGRIPPTS